MSDTEQSIGRYTSGDLRERLHAALRAAGKEPAVLLPGDLGEADHFHTGGQAATAAVATALDIGLGTRVLDVGAGLGGPARFFASLGAVVTGVERDEELVQLARELNTASAKSGSVAMLVAPGQRTNLATGSFDTAVMLHVGMNLQNKAAVFAEVHRLLRPGGNFGIFDLMGTNALEYPMPWADSPAASYVEAASTYERYLRTCGFAIRQDVPGGTKMPAALPPTGQSTGDAGLEVPILLGADAHQRIRNVSAALKSGSLTARLLVALRP
ncbi:class I SAM-dependent methyltransferase [Paeniglutamicibacter gangotriensis]|uniref:class I SAM-dependent methyltransferase n=1 Tax=Paeniglutamicibacter gangotriensis TaxID=254787 RepID=UPI0037CCA2E3